MPSIAAQARARGLDPACVRQRLHSGWTLQDALDTPLLRRQVLPDLPYQEVREALRTLTTPDVAARYGVSAACVRQWRSKLGIPSPRPPGAAKWAQRSAPA